MSPSFCGVPFGSSPWLLGPCLVTGGALRCGSLWEPEWEVWGQGVAVEGKNSLSWGGLGKEIKVVAHAN